MQKVQFLDLGTIGYKEAWDFQDVLFNENVQTKIKNRKEETNLPTHHYLLFCEHPHVYTLGKSGNENHLLANPEFLKQINATYFKTNRGGDITYHGPGQIVGYPIIDLEHFFTDIHKYMRFLEEIIIRTLADYGLKGERYPGYTGVWLDPDMPHKARKICAMGVKSSRWVTMHGFAFNVNPDLNYFNYIVPCGISDKQVTSLQKELNTEIDVKQVKERIKHHFKEVFECEIIPFEREELLNQLQSNEKMD